MPGRLARVRSGIPTTRGELVALPVSRRCRRKFACDDDVEREQLELYGEPERERSRERVEKVTDDALLTRRKGERLGVLG
jgi:hypothetical protein